jgi:hypothetical protein
MEKMEFPETTGGLGGLDVFLGGEEDETLFDAPPGSSMIKSSPNAMENNDIKIINAVNVFIQNTPGF